VQKALEEEGVDYEVVKGPLRNGRREELERLRGQREYPAIEFSDGRVHREESSVMARRIYEGKLDNAASERA
jgi:hypothetical protein